jgi:hypothetical protein
MAREQELSRAARWPCPARSWLWALSALLAILLSRFLLLTRASSLLASTAQLYSVTKWRKIRVAKDLDGEICGGERFGFYSKSVSMIHCTCHAMI